MTCFVGYVVAINLFRQEVIANQYHHQAANAFSRGKYVVAESFFDRYRLSHDLSPKQELFWAQILSSTGQGQQARDIIHSLAPDQSAGLPAAHHIRALNIAARIKFDEQVIKTENDILDQLKFHLEKSKNNSPDAQEAWALYYASKKDFNSAFDHLKLAAQTSPIHYLLLADLAVKSNHPNVEREALKNAESAFKERLKEDALDWGTRKQLGTILARKGDLTTAQLVMEEGKRLRPNQEYLEELYGFYLLCFDKSYETGSSLKVPVMCLSNAINANRIENKPFQLLVAIARESLPGKPESEATRKSLIEISGAEKIGGLGHLLLGQSNFESGNEKQAEFHFEMACNLDQRIPFVASKLAWLLSREKSPRLELALKLAKLATDVEPQGVQYNGILGSIYLQMGQVDKALPQLKKTVAKFPDDARVNRLLAEAYTKVGNPDLAEAHRKRFEELNNKR